MKYRHTLFIFCASFFIAQYTNGQSATAYTPGNSLRIDFEGRHKIVDHRTVSSISYQPGAILRVDFEGRHKIVDHRGPAIHAYTPGPALRIDFMGLHRNRFVPIQK